MNQISNSLAQQAQAFTGGMYAPILSNHDFTRAMTKMAGDMNRAKAAASVLLTAPGVPIRQAMSYVVRGPIPGMEAIVDLTNL